MPRRSSPTSGPARPEVMALLAAAKDNAADDAPRLILADWLEEHGEPDRAEFLRLGCERARIPRSDSCRPALAARCREIEARHAAAWLGPLQEKGVGCEFRRGLLHLGLPARKFLSRRWEALGTTEVFGWVEGAMPVGASARDVPRLADCPLLAHLTALDLHRYHFGSQTLQALLASPYTSRLTALNLAHLRLGPPDMKALALSTRLTRLTDLDLGGNRIRDEGLALFLLTSPHLHNFVRLSLEDCEIGPAGARALANCPRLTRLTTLDLSFNSIGDEGAMALAASANLPQLTHLDLLSCGIRDAGARALANSHRPDGWTILNLRGNLISAALRAELEESLGPGVLISQL